MTEEQEIETEELEGDFPGSAVVETWPSNAGGTALIPGCGTTIPYSVECSQNVKNTLRKKKKIE